MVGSYFVVLNLSFCLPWYVETLILIKPIVLPWILDFSFKMRVLLWTTFSLSHKLPHSLDLWTINHASWSSFVSILPVIFSLLKRKISTVTNIVYITESKTFIDMTECVGIIFSFLIIFTCLLTLYCVCERERERVCVYASERAIILETLGTIPCYK